MKKKNELDKIQNEAARIATGTTKLASIHVLYSEIRWDSLQQRRNNHKLTLFYKMTHNLTPEYVSTLVPKPISNISSYNLPNSNNFRAINTRTSQYSYHQQLESGTICLLKDKAQVSQYFYTGSRKAQILHTHLLMYKL